MRTFLAPALLGAALLTGLTACEFSVGDTKVIASDVEQQIKDKLGTQVGGIQDVTCPGDLPGEVGSTLTCTMVTGDGTSRTVNVTVTSVEGSQVNFDMEAPPVG
ncbi:DUF4333 domain-containing protein [Actinocorallia sp. B10E7]|uniref:DUF4333 domain-containing protein n=1 Tax=Actinocorallia sp. B10E7 TaxID=3153558 RepID=UPI00325E790B